MPGVVSDTGYIDNLIGDTINQRIGYGGCCGDVNNAVRTRNPSDSMEFLWYLPTTNYKDIVIKYETELSSVKSGQKEQIFSYSLDSGTSYKTTSMPIYSNFADTVWELVTLDLRSITGVNNNSKFVLKIDFSAPDTGSKGNNRFDNITVEGNSIVAIHNIENNLSNHYTLYPNPADDNIRLTSVLDGNRNILIYNSAGDLVSTYTMAGKMLLISTANLKPGTYFMKISENSIDRISTLKFIRK